MSITRINALRSLILQAKTAYYYSASPIMDDASFDALEDELRLLSPEDAVLALVGSPVPAGSMLTKARHSMPMGSQNKVNTEEQFRAWCAKNSTRRLHASLKGDGASAGAYYVNGRLTQTITRGDGEVGEDISANAMKFKGLPAFAGDAQGSFAGSVRFEVILTVEDWGKVDPSKSKNPRNVGNGIAGRKSGIQCELLTAYAFDIDEVRDGVAVQWVSETQKTERLAELGFNVIEHKCFESPDETVDYYRAIAKDRASLPIWIDGVVMKIDDIAVQREMGFVSGCPKGQISWKFDAAGAETVLEAVVVSGGHTGGLFPTAQFRSVEIGGTSVSSATLANYDEIARLGIAIGDSCWVIKANDIIPKITHVTHRPESRQSIETPCACPFCGGEVGRRVKSGGDEGAILMCKNAECPKKSVGKIGRWISSLDILGIGDAVLESMVERFDLADAADLYTLRQREGKMATLVTNTEKSLSRHCLGAKRTASILDAIDATRTLSLSQFLGSLGIDFLGKRRVEIMIAAADGDLDNLSDWRSAKLNNPEFAAKAGVPGIGAQVQAAIDAMSGLIDKMLANGVSVMAAEKASPKDETLKSVCISGKLPSGKKKADYAQPLLARGYELVDEVAKGLSFLVLADPTSTSEKSKKALKLGVQVISEDQLLALLQ